MFSTNKKAYFLTFFSSKGLDYKTAQLAGDNQLAIQKRRRGFELWTENK